MLEPSGSRPFAAARASGPPGSLSSAQNSPCTRTLMRIFTKKSSSASAVKVSPSCTSTTVAGWMWSATHPAFEQRDAVLLHPLRVLRVPGLQDVRVRALARGADVILVAAH